MLIYHYVRLIGFDADGHPLVEFRLTGQGPPELVTLTIEEEGTNIVWGSVQKQIESKYRLSHRNNQKQLRSTQVQKAIMV